MQVAKIIKERSRNSTFISALKNVRKSKLGRDIPKVIFFIPRIISILIYLILFIQ